VVCTQLALRQLIQHLNVLFLIEELILVEFVRLYYHAPTVSVGVVVEQVWIVLDLSIQFHNLAREWGINQKCLNLAVIAGGDGNQQIFCSYFITTPHYLRRVVIDVLDIRVALELAIVLRSGEYYSNDVAVLGTDEFTDSNLHRFGLVIQGLEPKVLQCVLTVVCDAELGVVAV